MTNKIRILTGILLGLIGVVGALSFYSNYRVHHDLAQVAEVAMPAVQRIGLASAEFYRFRGDAWKHFSSADAAVKQAVDAAMNEVKQDFEVQMKAYQAGIQSGDDREQYARLERAAGLYFGAWPAIAQKSREGAREEAQAA